MHSIKKINKDTIAVNDILPPQLSLHSTSPCRTRDHQSIEVRQVYLAYNTALHVSKIKAATL